jgi:hypothetical protein
MREKLKFDAGRHLYGVLGSYDSLERFMQNDLAGASDTAGNQFPKPMNLNRALLERIDDTALRNLIEREARRPQQVYQYLTDELNKLLQDTLHKNPFLILHQIELLFAYALDFATLRRHASNQNRILLLLPGKRFGDHIILFHEAGVEFQRSLPTNIIAENHLWELADE